MKKKTAGKRKANNMANRELRFTRSLFRSQNLALVRTRGELAALNYKRMREVVVGQLVQNGISDLPHHWVVTLVVICSTEDGQRFFKANEVEPSGQYRADQLTEVLDQHMQELIDTCNPKHILHTAWIATPYRASLSEEKIDSILEFMGAWEEV